jgi:hypothetical protein
MADAPVLGVVAFHEQDAREGVHLRRGGWVTLCGIDFAGPGY